MASSLRTKLRIGASVLFAAGFWDAIAGRFLFQPAATAFRDEAHLALEWPWRELRGALHIHSTYSDGAGDIPTVMDAASKADVDWVLLCDHNTQQPLRDGWENRYENAPLLLVGTEISVEGGAFLLALDMPPKWEPTRDMTPQATIDEVNAHGGLPLVSLPFDVKHPWQDWDAVGFDGLEVINFSTIARRHINLLSLLWLLPLYRIAGTMAVLRALLTRPDDALARWDTLISNGRGRSVGIGALDAHALMKIGKKKYPIPSYEESFRAVKTHVLIPESIDRSSGTIRSAIYDSLREGRCFFSYDCLGDPSGARFFAIDSSKSAKTVFLGGKLLRDTDSDDSIELIATSKPGVLLRLFFDGKIVAAGNNGYLSHKADCPGAYRVEASRYAFHIGPFYFGARPWFYSNPIYILDR